MKRIVSLLLVLVLALSAAALAEGAYPSYLNLDSQIPVVKEGEEAPTLRMILQRRVGGSEWEQLWIAKYIATYLNVKLEVEMVDNAEALAERKTLMFAGGDLPDLIMNMDLSTNDIITYGQMNGQLLKMDGYISEELTPNMVKWFEENPAAKATATTPDGHIYTLPKMMAVDNEGDLRRLFINTAWLEEIGMEAPATLDELLASSDVITLHCPLTEKTQGLIGSEAIARMKDGVRVINTARGPLVNEGAMAEALLCGKVACYMADVLSAEPPSPDNPLLSAPNTILTPHVAWAPRQTRARLEEIAVGNVRAFLEGAPRNVVSL